MPPPFFTAASSVHRRPRTGRLAVVLVGFAAVLLMLPVSSAVGGASQVAPSAPMNLRVALATQTSIDIVWDASTDDVAVAGYVVWFGQPTSKDPIRHQPSYETKQPRLAFKRLACGQSYAVEVVAQDRAGNESDPLRSIVSTAPCVDAEPPLAPTGVFQKVTSTASVTLAWAASVDNVGVAGYVLRRDGVEIGTTSATSYSVSGLSCGRTYGIAVSAFDVAGNRSSWVEFYVRTADCGDVTAPTAPAGLVQTNKSASSMAVAWSSSSDSGGVARYDTFLNGSPVGSANGLSYSFTGLACAKTHTVGVEAVDNAGNRSSRTSATMSTAACASPPAPTPPPSPMPPPGHAPSPPTNDLQPPSTPANLTLALAAPTAVKLTWSPSTDNVGVTGYGVYQGGRRLQVVTGTSYLFQGLTCGASYQLGVEAYDAKGNRSGRSLVVASTTPCSDSSAPTAPRNPATLDRTPSSVTLVWEASSDNVGVAGYGAYVDGTLAGSTPSPMYTFTGLACGTLFVFGFDAYDGSGNRSTTVNVAASTTACDDQQPPTTPSQLKSSSPTQTALTLSWSASSDNAGVAGYDVFVNGSKTATVNATAYTVGSLTCAKTYTLGVQAFDAAGNRSGVSTVSGATAPCPLQLPLGGDLFVSPNGSDAAPCSQSAPCRSFNRAYQVAALGSRVLVAAGDYPQQTIVDSPAKDTSGIAPHVVFDGVPGQTRVAGLRLGQEVEDNRGPDHLTVKNITGMPGTDLFVGGNDANDIVVDGYSARSFYVNGAQNLTIKNGSFGPGQAPATPNSKIDGNPTNDNINIVGNTIHDYTFGPSCAGYGGTYDCHGEGLILFGGKNLNISGNKFYANWTYSIFIQWTNPAFSARICNNFFGATADGTGKTRDTALTFGTNSLANVLVCFNSFAPGQRLVDENGGSFTNVRAIANIFGASAACIPGVAYAYNVWTGGTCSSTDRSTPSLPYVNASGYADQDYRLTPGSVAEGLVTATGGDYDLVTDIDGQVRSAPRDAGADERS